MREEEEQEDTGGGAKSGLYNGDHKLSGTDGTFSKLKVGTKQSYDEGQESGMETITNVSVSILEQFTNLLDGAVRIKNGVNLYKISINEDPFSMTWTKQGFGIARSVGRLAASVGVITKTENSEDTAATNIAAMYPENDRQRIMTEFKQIVGGKGWASVAEKIVFTSSKISVYVGVFTGTKEITISNTDDEDAFKEKIKQMYINMTDDV